MSEKTEKLHSAGKHPPHLFPSSYRFTRMWSHVQDSLKQHIFLNFLHDLTIWEVSVRRHDVGEIGQSLAQEKRKVKRCNERWSQPSLDRTWAMETSLFFFFIKMYFLSLTFRLLKVVQTLNEMFCSKESTKTRPFEHVKKGTHLLFPVTLCLFIPDWSQWVTGCLIDTYTHTQLHRQGYCSVLL